MNDGVAMLLERMKTNPEEFDVGYSTKWNQLINAYKELLEPEDQQTLTEGLKKLMQQRFTEKVMEELIDPKSDSLEDVINQYRVKGMPSVTTTPQQFSAGLYSNGIGGNATLLAQQQLQTEHIKAHVEALQQEYTDVFKQKPKEHKTLFGKLFSYQ